MCSHEDVLAYPGLCNYLLQIVYILTTESLGYILTLRLYAYFLRIVHLLTSDCVLLTSNCILTYTRLWTCLLFILYLPYLPRNCVLSLRTPDCVYLLTLASVLTYPGLCTYLPRIVYTLTLYYVCTYPGLCTYLPRIVYLLTLYCVPTYPGLRSYLLSPDCVLTYTWLYTYLLRIVYILTPDCVLTYPCLCTYLPLIGIPHWSTHKQVHFVCRGLWIPCIYSKRQC